MIFCNNISIGRNSFIICTVSLQNIGKDLTIGDNVGIGSKLGNVKDDQGFVIGAGSIQTQYSTPYFVVAGNPAKTTKIR